MSPAVADKTKRPPLDLEGFEDWIIERGLRGLPIEEHLSGFCQRIYDAGFPMQRASMGLGTLHPRYGAHSFVWNQNTGAVENTPHERTSSERALYKQSPIFHMRENALLAYRSRLDKNEPLEFPILEELRTQGMTEYAAQIVPYDPNKISQTGLHTPSFSASHNMTTPLEGIFFSCATDDPEGFDDHQLDQVGRSLKYVALAVKSRLTYDVGNTVLETYLGADAGHRVLTGAIERGSVETIRAVIWLCDLRGFTEFADIVPRDELVGMLDDYLETMARPVHNNRGQILKFMGDGFLATFNLSELDDSAVCANALKAAAELRQGIHEINTQREAANKPIMDFGLALHLGEVLYGNIGASDRLDFTVVGPAVNEASRMEALCRPLKRRVLVSSTFFEKATACHDKLIPLGSHRLRGVTEPQDIYTLVR